MVDEYIGPSVYLAGMGSHRGGTAIVLVTGLLLLWVVGLVVVKLLGVVVWLEVTRLVATKLLLMGLVLTCAPPCGR